MPGQQTWMAGGGIGVSTLSADAQSSITPASTAVSQYKPENGFLLHSFAGGHLHEYLAVQGVWSWNRNRLGLLSTRFENGIESTYEQARASSQHNGAVDVLLFFRNRRSFIRPYLSVGIGVMSFRSTETALLTRKGNAVPPPQRFTAVEPGLRVAAGIDLLIRNGWGIRYFFLETSQTNPVSQRLTPPGRRRMANFQNLFGFVKYF